MSWEWSHTEDAYDNARANLEELPRNELMTILEEWLVHLSLGTLEYGSVKDDEFNTVENIADAIWRFCSSWDHGRTCDNGGFNAWMCPHGCHTVPFDRMEEE